MFAALAKLDDGIKIPRKGLLQFQRSNSNWGKNDSSAYFPRFQFFVPSEEILEHELMDSSEDDEYLDSCHTKVSSSEDDADSDVDSEAAFVDGQTHILRLLDRIKNHFVFQNDSAYPQAIVMVQLGVALDRLGHEGNDVCIDRTKELWGCLMAPS
ncbi:hypothetical protein R1sor_021712 [Riccia sorocarpa]|uniref:Uncharacterized protein n=1 Tax=Riccia sorocarpa TaxID=122646 RepID=A0ABD3GJ99_9MARC